MQITLKTLANATADEVFEQIASHMLTQSAKALRYMPQTRTQEACGYRSDCGQLKCAAGCLISDDEYTPNMEGQRWVDLQMKGIVPPVHTEIIQTFQNIHDAADVPEWPRLIEDFRCKVKALKN